jgi:predicted RNase H-like HicB family nuclease
MTEDKLPSEEERSQELSPEEIAVRDRSKVYQRLADETGTISIHIKWSDEDNAFLVTIPGLNYLQPVCHGDTVEEALEMAKQVIANDIEIEAEDSQPDS